MGRPLKITYQITPNEISALIRTKKDGRIRQRLMAMKFILHGQSIPQTAQRMDIAERPLRKWLHRFNKKGSDGLADAPRSGQPQKIKACQIEKFKLRVRQGITEQDKVCSLRGKDLQQILKKEFNAKYSLGGTYFLLHRLGFSCLCPRPQHPQAEDVFKKTASRGR
ncbi:MAG: winged helix-turn-helix domain-containing protein [Phycisphaerales bacterium]